MGYKLSMCQKWDIPQNPPINSQLVETFFFHSYCIDKNTPCFNFENWNSFFIFIVSILIRILSLAISDHSSLIDLAPIVPRWPSSDHRSSLRSLIANHSSWRLRSRTILPRSRSTKPCFARDYLTVLQQGFQGFSLLFLGFMKIFKCSLIWLI